MTDLERLIALEEIKQVKARYFRCMDTKDWAAFEAVFAPDATADYSSEGDAKEWSASGAAKIVALVRRVVESAISVHHGHMAEVEVTSPTSARGIFAMEDLIWWPEGSRRKTQCGCRQHQVLRNMTGFGNQHPIATLAVFSFVAREVTGQANHGGCPADHLPFHGKHRTDDRVFIDGGLHYLEHVIDHVIVVDSRI